MLVRPAAVGFAWGQSAESLLIKTGEDLSVYHNDSSKLDAPSHTFLFLQKAVYTSAQANHPELAWPRGIPVPIIEANPDGVDKDDFRAYIEHLRQPVEVYECQTIDDDKRMEIVRLALLELHRKYGWLEDALAGADFVTTGGLPIFRALGRAFLGKRLNCSETVAEPYEAAGVKISPVKAVDSTPVEIYSYVKNSPDWKMISDPAWGPRKG